MKVLNTQNTEELAELVIKYRADEQAIFKLQNELSDAKAKLTALENEITGDIEAGAKMAVKLSGKVAENEFKVNAMTNRRNALSENIRRTGEQVVIDYQSEKTKLSRAQADAVKTLTSSPEIEKAIEIIHAAYQLQGRLYWESLTKQIGLTYEPTREQSEAAATNLQLDTDYYLTLPDSLNEARDITGHEFNLSGVH